MTSRVLVAARARHGFPLFAFHQRLAEWWRDLLDSLGEHTVAGETSVPPSGRLTSG